MKKIFTLLCCLIALSQYTQAQHCAASSNNMTPLQAGGISGFSPSFYNNACIDSGTVVSDTIYFVNFTSVLDSNTSVPLNSLTFDSINNLPSGLCWTTNKASNQFAAGETGVIVISGICSGHVGQYKLSFVVDINAGSGGSINFVRTNADQLTGNVGNNLKYYLRVKSYGSSCPPVDTTLGSITVLLNASISQSASVVCAGSTVSLTGNSCSGCTYSWSTGATTQTIYVTTGGSYVVTISDGVTTAVSAPTNLIYDTPPTASFSIAQDVSQSNLWHTTNNTVYSHLAWASWSWGDGSYDGDSVLSPSHLYAGGGSYAICLTIHDSIGCTNSHCDSTGAVIVPLPSIATISTAGVFIICNSNPLTLTTNYCSGCTYLWSSGQTTQSIQTRSLGSYTVTISNGSNSVVSAPVSLAGDSILVSFTLTPDASQSNLIHAQNTSVGVSHRINYSIWNWGDGLESIDSLTLDSHLYTTAGTFSVCLTVSDSVGCQVSKCDSSGTIVLPLPTTATITPSARVSCNNNSVLLSADICTNCTYLWSNNATTQAIAVGPGTYTVTITSGANSVTSAPFTLGSDIVTASFALQPDTNVAHHWFVINNCYGSNPLNYQWSWGDGSWGDSSATPAHTFSAAGYYDICVSVNDANGCSASFCDSSTYLSRSQAIISVQVIPGTVNGINDISSNTAVKVYPNPSTGSLTIESTSTATQTAVIYDALGRQLREVNISAAKTTLNLSELTDGVYTLSFRNNTSPAVRFLIAK